MNYLAKKNKRRHNTLAGKLDLKRNSLQKAPETKFWKIVLAPPSQTRAADPAYDFQNLFLALFGIIHNTMTSIFNSAQYKNQRVAVLIDVQNLYHSARALFQKRVNFKELVSSALGERQLVRAFAYVVRTKTGEEKSFFEALTKLGIDIRVKDLQEYYGGMKKADWDVGIAVDAIKTAEIVDVIVIASGDGDYAPLVEYLKNQGRRVEVMAFGRSASAKLKEIADEFVDLEENTKRYLIRGGAKDE